MFKPISILKPPDLVEAKNRAVVIEQPDKDGERRDGVVLTENVNQETSTDDPLPTTRASQLGDNAPLPGKVFMKLSFLNPRKTRGSHLTYTYT